MPNTLRMVLLIAGYALYVVFVMPLRLLASLLKRSPEAVLLFKPSMHGIAVEHRARGEALRLVYDWASGMGLLLTLQGQLVKKSRPGTLRGYVLSMAASLKTYMESRGYAVRVMFKEVFGGEPFAVVEVKRKNLLPRISEIISRVL
ncbi:hypothetical protein IG193_08205 [Infirmifilum lucidum]|uniref:Uncharacterized protein n=1 Tax=Infirmifilum lucidum TaxID=2776706 RepID=A0A7L9FFY0_9CREN|nr:hypothetical protein [Infirmifilum lucidum]QOJ78718.1 hypothetical protein IG193_08205 [Infirmifilum lucidum]